MYMNHPSLQSDTGDKDREMGTGSIPPDWLDEESVLNVIGALRRRKVFPDGGEAIGRVRTHISSVFLTSEFAFKFKRPVDVGFADFRSLESRKHFCEVEVRLNGRLAQGVYLGVLPLFRDPGGFTFDRVGSPVDYCVVMRRLPPESMLDLRLKRGWVTPEDLRALAEVLWDFHRKTGARDDLKRYGDLAVIRENWEENFQQTRHLIGNALSGQDFHAIRGAVEAFMVRNEGLFRERVEEGQIRDGHGDLRCEHVHMGPDGIRIIDCIEFNDRFRFGDVANDLAFLLMDLTALGHPEASRLVLAHYLSLSGDAHLPRLVPFYACYRAYVRGKVAGFKLGDRDLDPGERDALLNKAASFFRLAGAFARQMHPPVLVLVAGLMGTGKTTLARMLSEATGMDHHNSDSIRKALPDDPALTPSPEGGAGKPPGPGKPGRDHSEAEFGGGIYTPAWNARTYEALLARGVEALQAGRSVVLDASFARQADRERAFQMAASEGARAVFIECRLDEEAALRRLKDRWEEGASPSDGRVELYPRQKAAFEPIAPSPGVRHLVAHTDRAPEALVQEMLGKLELPPPLFSSPQ